jgi:hypothetical protein
VLDYSTLSYDDIMYHVDSIVVAGCLGSGGVSGDNKPAESKEVSEGRSPPLVITHETDDTIAAPAVMQD